VIVKWMLTERSDWILGGVVEHPWQILASERKVVFPIAPEASEPTQRQERKALPNVRFFCCAASTVRSRPDR